MSPGPELPLVCSLDPGDLPLRLERWRALLACARSREATPSGERLSFAPAPGLAAEIAGLCEAEQGCCAFFRFTLSLGTDKLTLTVEAPTDARAMVRELLGA